MFNILRYNHFSKYTACEITFPLPKINLLKKICENILAQEENYLKFLYKILFRNITCKINFLLLKIILFKAFEETKCRIKVLELYSE